MAMMRRAPSFREFLLIMMRRATRVSELKLLCDAMATWWTAIGFPIDSHFEGWVSYHSLTLREIGQYYDVESDALDLGGSDSEDGED